MSSAENNQLAACKWLVDHGADVNKRMPGTGWTAMHAACKKGNYAVLEYLLQSGGDKKLEASHREFGENLKVADLTTDPEFYKMLAQY
jgi:ankyrin repeat protein